MKYWHAVDVYNIHTYILLLQYTSVHNTNYEYIFFFAPD